MRRVVCGTIIHPWISISKTLFLKGATLVKREIRILGEWQERTNTPPHCLMAACKTLEYSSCLSSNYGRRFNWISFVRRGFDYFSFIVLKVEYMRQFMCLYMCACVRFLTWRNGLLRQLSIYWIYHRTWKWCRQLYDVTLLQQKPFSTKYFHIFSRVST